VLVALLACGAWQLGLAVSSAAANPPNDWSFYVAPGDSYSGAETLGCNQAHYDTSVQNESLVTLDFGAQTSNGAGTYLPSTVTYWSNGTDELYAEWFAYGYQDCSNGDYYLELNVGTNNDGSVTNGNIGGIWGSLVQTVATNASDWGYSNVSINGAIDAEAGYSSFADVDDWMWGDSSGTGYANHTGALIADFGTADGCPSYYTSSNLDCSGWYESDIYYLSWGWPASEAQPEIYYAGNGYANQPIQWADISDVGAHCCGGEIYFWASLSQNSPLSPDESYSYLVDATSHQGVGDSPSYETQIVTK
jgi:hypothetical protein